MILKYFLFIFSILFIGIVFAQLPEVALNDTSKNLTRSSSTHMIPIVEMSNPGNMSVLNVNDSLYWDGFGWDLDRWLLIDGSNANQNIDIGVYNLTTSMVRIGTTNFSSGRIVDSSISGINFGSTDLTTLGSITTKGILTTVDINMANNDIVNSGSITLAGSVLSEQGSYNLSFADVSDMIFSGVEGVAFIPNTDLWHPLGSSSKRWNETYSKYFIGDGSKLHSVNISDNYAKYQFTTNNFNGSGNFTTIGKGIAYDGFDGQGNELVDDPEMDNVNSEWDEGGGWSCSAGTCDVGGGQAGNNNETNPITAVVGRVYIIEGNVVSVDTTSPITILFGGTRKALSSTGDFIFSLIATKDNELSLEKSVGAPCSITSISIKEATLSEFADVNIYNNLNVTRNIIVKQNLSIQGILDVNSLTIKQEDVAIGIGGTMSNVLTIIGGSPTDVIGAGGGIKIQAGNHFGSANDGAIVNITSGTADQTGGHIYLTTGKGGTSYGNVILNRNGGNIWFDGDLQKFFFGEGQDAGLYYNGTDFIINSGEVGSGQTYFKESVVINKNLHLEGNFIGNQIYGELWTYSYAGNTFNFAIQKHYYNTTFSSTTMNGFDFLHNQQFNVLHDGVYKVDFQATGEGVNNHIYELGIAKDQIQQNNTNTFVKLEGAGAIATMSGTGIMNLTKGENVTLRMRDITGTGVAKIYSMNLNAVRIGN